MFFAELLIVVGLTLLNGIFSGAEIAVVSVRRTRLQQLVDQRRPGAHALAALREQPERFFATVQIGITVIATAAAAFGGLTMARHLEPHLAKVPGLGREAAPISLVLVVALVSYLSLVFGELVPKSLALRASEPYALVMAKPLLWLSFVARPVVKGLIWSSNLVLRPFRDSTDFMESRISPEELRQMVDEAARTGALHVSTGEIASRALAFERLTLRDASIPRDRIDALPRDATPEQIRHFLLEERRSRIPIYDGTLDDIVGYASAKDIVSVAWDGKLVVLQDVLRPVKFFPETTAAIEVLRYMRRERQRVVVSVDEHGVVSGLATFEDLVEELVGDISSEDEEERAPIVHELDGSAVVRGDVPLREVNRALDLTLPESPGATTIGGLAAKLGGGIPNRNARLAAPDGTVLIVLEASPRAVRRVRVIRHSPVTSPPERAAGP
ncbi:MAG TPA: hemolysin family protein [Polyangia bacterium]|nr:hemolysin family protein [Polyangia bacterium]